MSGDSAACPPALVQWHVKRQVIDSFLHIEQGDFAVETDLYCCLPCCPAFVLV